MNRGAIVTGTTAGIPKEEVKKRRPEIVPGLPGIAFYSGGQGLAEEPCSPSYWRKSGKQPIINRWQ